MRNYRVAAKRWDHGWELHIDGVGVTQTRSLALAVRDARDYIELISGSAEFAVHLDVDLGRYAGQVSDLREQQQRAADLQTEVAARWRKLVAEFSESGLTNDDIARVLNISPQRVSQLSAR